ncbi:MAG TPA: DNA translocase FtsK [Fimbriimonas sp.]|nr:DNA translocase FtsK [Fimbriimonas sp.]
MSKAKPETQTVTFSMPVDGKTIKTVINSFCKKPVKDDDTFEHCSVGVAANSIVATDGRSAILLGKPANMHFATQRKEALLEAERANLYGEPARIEQIPRNVDGEGKARMMVDVQGVIKERMGSMTSLASFSPEALLAIGKAAVAAGAHQVELLIPEGDDRSSTLGFKFTAPIKEGFLDLFSDYDGHTFDACGIFAVRRSEPRQATIDELPAKPVEKRKSTSKRAAGLVVITNEKPEPEEPGESEKIQPIDLNAAETQAVVDVDEVRTNNGLELPSIKLLHSDEQGEAKEPGEYASAITEVLRSFNINGTVDKFQRGPVITQYQVEIPRNVKTSKVTALADNIQMSLSVESVRIEAPIPGVNAIGIEVPNKERSKVFLRDLVIRQAFWQAPPLTFAIGMDVSGRPVYADMTKMPHLLIAGATNSGKSVGLATLISSLLMRHSPKELRFVMIDPKRVELTLFDNIPHLLCPVIKDVKEAPGVLRAVWREMDRRYDLLSDNGVRNIEGFNEKVEEASRMPYIVVVIDELADLMIQAKAEVETSITRLTAMARAVGIHLVIATQRPSVDVITGLIKANVPSRIAYATAQRVDSQTILDQPGAEKLLGRGDMLYFPIGASKPTRLQGVFMSEIEIEAICSHWRAQEPTKYAFDPAEFERLPDGAKSIDGERDEMLEEIARWAVKTGQVSTSMIQRKFRFGLQRASRLLEQMEELRMIGPRNGPNAREVLITEKELDRLIEELDS